MDDASLIIFASAFFVSYKTSSSQKVQPVSCSSTSLRLSQLSAVKSQTFLFQTSTKNDDFTIPHPGYASGNYFYGHLSNLCGCLSRNRPKVQDLRRVLPDVFLQLPQAMPARWTRSLVALGVRMDAPTLATTKWRSDIDAGPETDLPWFLDNRIFTTVVIQSLVG